MEQTFIPTSSFYVTQLKKWSECSQQGEHYIKATQRAVSKSTCATQCCFSTGRQRSNPSLPLLEKPWKQPGDNCVMAEDGGQEHSFPPGKLSQCGVTMYVGGLRERENRNFRYLVRDCFKFRMFFQQKPY